MIVDSKGKLFGKISIIDILVVFVILGIIAGVGYKYTRSNTPTVFTKQDDLEISFFVEEAPDYTVNAIKIGDTAREAVQNALFGTVKDIKPDKSVTYTTNDQGEIKLSNKPGYLSVKVTMDGKGIYGTNGVTIDNSVYYIGKSIELRVGNVAFWGKISNIKLKD